MPSLVGTSSRDGEDAINSEANPSLPRLLVPSLRGRMGDWAYYVCLLELREVAARVRFAQELHKSTRLSTMIQRGMTSHADRIADYLLKQPQRFLNSLVVAVYAGEPHFHELSVTQTLQPTPDALPELVEMNMGVLELRGDERLMALDGQHRVKGIRSALTSNKRLGDEQIGIIFVAHSPTTAGVRRTRRLFTTLNRYAKPVSKFDIVAQDEDDSVAIVVRRLVDEHSALRERISSAIGSNIPAGDDTSVTTLPALYDAMDRLLRDRSPTEWAKYKRFHPGDDAIKARLIIAMAFWDELSRTVQVIRELGRNSARRISPDERGSNGGHLLLRPVGLISFAIATKALLDGGLPLADGVQRLASLPLELGTAPWLKVLWNPTSHRMITSAENKRAASEWLALAAGAPEGGSRTIARLSHEFRALDEDEATVAMRLLRRRRRGFDHPAQDD